MRVLHQDGREGETRIKIQNADDLCHLHNLLEPGDLVRAYTYRREEAASDKLRPERGEKVLVKLGIRVEQTEYQDFSDRLRITGVIEEGPQDLGRHHTLNIGVDDDLTIVKNAWREHHLRRIQEAIDATERPQVTVLSIDDEEALLAEVRQMGIREVATIRAGHHGKMFPGAETRVTYFEEILSKLASMDIGSALLVVGPGFEREEFAKFVRERNPELAGKIRLHGTSQAGVGGVEAGGEGGAGAEGLEGTPGAPGARPLARVGA